MTTIVDILNSTSQLFICREDKKKMHLCLTWTSKNKCKSGFDYFR